MIITGDSLQELKQLPPNSIDSVVTDPPYGLKFMSKAWDYDVPTKELWTEVLRVLKPGGYLLSFAGTRTQHRMAVNIEDAGFEIRDMIAWVYGSGFPKSHNIGKAVDKIQGNDREVTGELKLTGTARNTKTIGAKTSSAITSDYEVNNTKTNISKGTSPHEGWGTALKPALEPITVARKPFPGTVANNVLEWGTGGINIDGSRVGTEENLAGGSGRVGGFAGKTQGGDTSNYRVEGHTQGRFPSNLIHDGSDEVVGLFPDTKSGGGDKHGRKPSTFNASTDWEKYKGTSAGGDSGSAARFFYCAKASKSERNKGLEGFEEQQTVGGGGGIGDYLDDVNSASGKYGSEKAPNKNNHPTVKPVKLMQYLVKLVTPVGGTVLDPFNGSGTTGIAAKLENFEYIGIELDPEYVKLSEARIDAWTKENTLV